MVARSEIAAEAGVGLAGDRYATRTGSFSGRPGTGREVTLIAREAIAAVNAEGEVTIGEHETRRNLVTEGVPLADLVGRTFRVGDVVLHGCRLADRARTSKHDARRSPRCALASWRPARRHRHERASCGSVTRSAKSKPGMSSREDDDRAYRHPDHRPRPRARTRRDRSGGAPAARRHGPARARCELAATRAPCCAWSGSETSCSASARSRPSRTTRRTPSGCDGCGRRRGDAIAFLVAPIGFRRFTNGAFAGRGAPGSGS